MSKEGKPRTIIVNWQPPSEANGKITGKMLLSVSVPSSCLVESLQESAVLFLRRNGSLKAAWSLYEEP